MRLRTAVVLLSLFPSLFLSAAFAAQPPAKVDRALRARITRYYELQVARQYRQAEDLIAEDSKEFYFEGKKPDVKSWSIDRIEYGPDSRTAVAYIRGKIQVMFGGGGPTIIDVLSPTTWKIDKGKWCWYHDESHQSDTPFGRVVSPPPGSPPPDPGVLFGKTAAAAAKGAVQADRTQIQLDASHPAPVVVTLKNLLPGGVTIHAINPPRGLRIEIAKSQLSANESTTVTITPVEGTAERPDVIFFAAAPLNQSIPVRIAWADSKK